MFAQVNALYLAAGFYLFLCALYLLIAGYAAWKMITWGQWRDLGRLIRFLPAIILGGGWFAYLPLRICCLVWELTDGRRGLLLVKIPAKVCALACGLLFVLPNALAFDY